MPDWLLVLVLALLASSLYRVLQRLRRIEQRLQHLSPLQRLPDQFRTLEGRLDGFHPRDLHTELRALHEGQRRAERARAESDAPSSAATAPPRTPHYEAFP